MNLPSYFLSDTGLGIYADSSDADSEVEEGAKADDQSDWEPDYVIKVSLQIWSFYVNLCSFSILGTYSYQIFSLWAEIQGDQGKVSENIRSWAEAIQ